MKFYYNYLLLAAVSFVYFSIEGPAPFSAMAASRNQTISEFGLALTYNTHLVMINETHGTPMLQGYFLVHGDNVTGATDP